MHFVTFSWGLGNKLKKFISPASAPNKSFAVADYSRLPQPFLTRMRRATKIYKNNEVPMLSHNSDTTLIRTSYTLLCFLNLGVQPRSIIFAGQRINSGTDNQFLSNPDAISAELHPTPVKF